MEFFTTEKNDGEIPELFCWYKQTTHAQPNEVSLLVRNSIKKQCGFLHNLNNCAAMTSMRRYKNSNNAKMLVNEELNHIQTCYDCMKRRVYTALPTHTFLRLFNTRAWPFFIWCACWREIIACLLSLLIIPGVGNDGSVLFKAEAFIRFYLINAWCVYLYYVHYFTQDIKTLSLYYLWPALCIKKCTNFVLEWN